MSCTLLYDLFMDDALRDNVLWPFEMMQRATSSVEKKACIHDVKRPREESKREETVTRISGSHFHFVWIFGDRLKNSRLHRVRFTSIYGKFPETFMSFF